MRRRTPIAIAIVLVTATGAARAQSRQIAEEPTQGVELPATPLSGDQDARATSVNPGGLVQVDGTALAIAITGDDRAVATSAGQGGGVFLASSSPYFHIGLGVEWLRPSRTRLAPDPGSPTRYTLGFGTPLGRHAGLGLSWHHFSDDLGAAGRGTGGLDTYDLGLSWRVTNRLAIGAVVRDVGAPRLGTVPIQRRWELETTVRPTGTDRLDLGLGGRVGETRGDVDGWLRASGRVARGVYLHGEVETRALELIDTALSGAQRDSEGRDLVATLGVEVSFGATGIATYGSAGWDDRHDFHALGGTVVARMSSVELPSVQGAPSRIERLELTGDLDARGAARMVMKLRAIARDPAVKAVVLTIDGVDAGWATVEELRDELRRISAAGKKTYAYLVEASTRDYFLATGCDKIYVDPAGGVRLTGFAGTTKYYKRAFDALGIQAQFEKIAEYKSAPEAYTDTGPSEPAQRMHAAMFDSILERLVEGIAESRKLDDDTVRKLIDGGPYSAGILDKDHRLIDAVADPDEVASLVSVDLGRLYPVSGPPAVKDDRWERPGIAVIYADGDIVDGKSQDIPFLGRHLVGGETMVDAIQRARADDSIKAIVLRIDSPGGSALASELMSREVFKTRKVKPIICSMSDVAASGGYYLAAGCDKIFAEPMTITGSIGIFTGKFDLSAMVQKFGLNVVTETRGAHADMDSLYRPYTDEEREIIRAQIRYMYERFTGAVADGRGMTKTAVDDVGRGHVWTGAMAKDVKLVDELGGLGDAIDYAKVQAGLGADEKVRLVELPKNGGGLLKLLLGGIVKAAVPQPSLASFGGLFKDALDGIPGSLLAEPGAAQARLPFDITWE